MIYIYNQMTEFTDDDFWEGYLSLTEERKKKVDTYRFMKDKKLSLLVYLLLKYGLEKEYGIIEPLKMKYGLRGKPYLENYPNIFFNMSHCDDGAVCVLSNRPVGIDIQNIISDSYLLINETMTTKEKQCVLKAENKDIEFTRFWTLKESYLKYCGSGLTNSLDKIDFSSGKGELFKEKGCLFRTKWIGKLCISLCAEEIQEIKFITKEDILYSKSTFIECPSEISISSEY